MGLLRAASLPPRTQCDQTYSQPGGIAASADWPATLRPCRAYRAAAVAASSELFFGFSRPREPPRKVAGRLALVDSKVADGRPSRGGSCRPARFWTAAR